MHAIFATPASPDFAEACAENFRARPTEQGVSLWQLPEDDVERVRVLAAFAARRSRRQKLLYLEMLPEWFDELGIVPCARRATQGFECVRDYHFEIDEPPEEALRRLSDAIRLSLLARPEL